MHAQSEVELGRVDIRLLVVKEAAFGAHPPPFHVRHRQAEDIVHRRFGRAHPLGDRGRKLFLLVQALDLPDTKPYEHQEGRYGPERHTGKRPETDHGDAGKTSSRTNSPEANVRPGSSRIHMARADTSALPRA